MDRRFTVVVTALLTCCAAAGLAQESLPVIDVAELSLEEKASLITGLNSWETHTVPRLGIPSVWMADGPVGLRKSTGKALTHTVPATCFPAAGAMAATWNPRLIEKVGAGIGAEGHFNDVTLASATDIRATLPLSLSTGTMPKEHYTLHHTLGGLYQDPRGRVVVDGILAQQGWKPLSEQAEDDFGAAVYRNLPFKKLSNFSEGAVTIETLLEMLDLINSDMSPEQVAEALESGSTTDVRY